jgi:hypothetical protein
MAKCQYCDSDDVVDGELSEQTDGFVPPKVHEVAVCRDCGRVSVGDETSSGGLFG